MRYARHYGGHDLVCAYCSARFHRPYNLASDRLSNPQYCGFVCFGRAKAQDRQLHQRELFWAKVQQREPNECWEWCGERDRRGYGKFRYNGTKGFLAHRASFEMVNGPIGEGLHICHRCDNPPCVNPSHLFAGTAKDNMEDASRKGRLKGRPGLKGEVSPRAKLTAEQVIVIFKSSEPQTVLAGRYGITGTAVRHIKARRNWRSTTEALDV